MPSAIEKLEKLREEKQRSNDRYEQSISETLEKIKPELRDESLELVAKISKYLECSHSEAVEFIAESADLKSKKKVRSTSKRGPKPKFQLSKKQEDKVLKLHSDGMKMLAITREIFGTEHSNGQYELIRKFLSEISTSS